MPQLNLRDVDFGLVRLLKQRAAKHGRTPDAEHRAILEQALRPEHQAGSSKIEHMFQALRFAGGAPPGEQDGSAG